MSLDIVGYQNDINSQISDAGKVGAADAGFLYLIANRKILKLSNSLVDFVDQMPPLTKFPMTPKHVLGTCHSRGRVFVVIDLSLLGDSTVGASSSGSSASLSKLIAIKGRDVALIAAFASSLEIDELEHVVLSLDSLLSTSVSLS